MLHAVHLNNNLQFFNHLWGQFYQRFLYERLFSKQSVYRKRRFTKNEREKCWWNLAVGSISSTFYLPIFCTKANWAAFLCLEFIFEGTFLWKLGALNVDEIDSEVNCLSRSSYGSSKNWLKPGSKSPQLFQMCYNILRLLKNLTQFLMTDGWQPYY